MYGQTVTSALHLTSIAPGLLQVSPPRLANLVLLNMLLGILVEVVERTSEAQEAESTVESSPNEFADE